MRPSLTRRNILVRRIPRWNCENLFHVIGKATVAQVQVGDTDQTEFVICDQSIDVNHGYSKTPVINSEIARKQEALQRRLENVQRWADGARKRMYKAGKLHNKRSQLTKERATELYRVLNDHQMELELQDVYRYLLRKTIREEKAVADAEIEEYQQ